MEKNKKRLWRELPENFDDDGKVTLFYEGMSLEKIVAYMTSVIAEWNMQWDDPIRDESVRSVELPLIKAFYTTQNIRTQLLSALNRRRSKKT